MVDQQDKVLSLQLCTPANAPIGLYCLTLETSTGYQGSSFVLGHFTLLFNAWCPGEPRFIQRGWVRSTWEAMEVGRARRGSSKVEPARSGCSSVFWPLVIPISSQAHGGKMTCSKQLPKHFNHMFKTHCSHGTVNP